MPLLELISYILAAAIFQLSIFGLLAFYRHWQVYQTIKSNLPDASAAKPVVEEYSPQETGEHQSRWTGIRQFRVDQKVFEDESHNICSFYLVPVDAQPLPIFKPGQFLTFDLPVPDPVSNEPKKVIRCYSLSDRPGLDYYRVSIKRQLAPLDASNVPAGLGSNYFHDHIEQGDVVDVRSPNGHFFMQPSNNPIVLIAGGIGITPMLSMLNTHLQSNNPTDIWLFYGVRNSADHAMKGVLERLAREHENFHLNVCYSKPLAKDELGKDYQHKGRVDIKLLRLTLPFKPCQFYICGPRPMMETMVPALDEWGVPEQDIHYEAFGPASLAKTKPKTEKTETSATPITVSLKKSGQSIPWDEDAGSLLDFLESNDIEVETGCRAGGCGACETTIEQGEVTYSQAPDFDPEPGNCLLCISRPTQDLTLEI